MTWNVAWAGIITVVFGHFFKEIHRAEGVGDIDGVPIKPQDLDRQELVILKTSESSPLNLARL